MPYRTSASEWVFAIVGSVAWISLAVGVGLLLRYEWFPLWAALVVWFAPIGTICAMGIVRWFRDTWLIGR